jgi:hypothetical protein
MCTTTHLWSGQNDVVKTVQVVNFAEGAFQFKAKYESSARDSFLPPNTVAGNDPVLILAASKRSLITAVG